MKRKYKVPGNYRLIFLAGVALYILNMDVLSQSPINILPLGNSITFDYDSFDETNPRPDGDRISYRYTLFQLLHDAGYHFDYVGSENSGNNYFQDPEFDDNAGFPGIETWQLTDLISTGYNAKTEVYVTQGPYLNFYPADIILLHIGTNNLIESASDVEALLNTIRSYDTDVIILVARIINRQTYHLPTSIFNNNVESMVNSRGDDRIFIVYMDAVNIDYTTDMADNLHPNPAGYDKMAHKWFEAIDNLNQTPEIAIIPEQMSSGGNPFPDLSLDDIVYDMEDGDSLLSWSYEQQAGSHLEVSIDDSRILHVVPLESWHGSEIVKLRVEDSGSGTFRKRDSVEVLFTVNAPPVITSLPTVSEIHVNEAYQYIITATDEDDEDSLAFFPVTIPGWLSFTPGMDTAILFGFASENDTGTNSIELMVSDGHYEVYQKFSLEVLSPTGILHDHIPVSRIYPNPTNNDIIIQNERAGIYFIDIASLNGQLIYSTELEGRSPRIDLSSFQKGVYFITIRSKDFVTTLKIIKL